MPGDLLGRYECRQDKEAPVLKLLPGGRGDHDFKFDFRSQ
jgi:hypothetical protein